jgi:antitoxin HicB
MTRVEFKEPMKIEYPARFRPERGGYVVTFPDVPEAITEGDTLDEAQAMASEALEVALTIYMENWRDLPASGALRRGLRMVRVPLLSAAKFGLYSAMRAAGVKKVELARRLGCAPSQVDRLLDIAHHSRLALMEAAFAAIGKRIEVEIRDAA